MPRGHTPSSIVGWSSSLHGSMGSQWLSGLSWSVGSLGRFSTFRRSVGVSAQFCDGFGFQFRESSRPWWFATSLDAFLVGRLSFDGYFFRALLRVHNEADFYRSRPLHFLARNELSPVRAV